MTGNTGIKVIERNATGQITVTLGGSVTGSRGPAMEMNSGESQGLVPNPGAGFPARLQASRSDAILELVAGTGQSGRFP